MGYFSKGNLIPYLKADYNCFEIFIKILRSYIINPGTPLKSKQPPLMLLYICIIAEEGGGLKSEITTASTAAYEIEANEIIEKGAHFVVIME